MNGVNTFVMRDTYEDSLLAAPLTLDRRYSRQVVLAPTRPYDAARARTGLSSTKRTSHLSPWSRAGHQQSARWAGPSHADATVNRVVVRHVSKFAEAEGQRSVKLLLSANPGQDCSPLHMLHDPGHGTCSAAATSVQVNLSFVSQL